MSLAGITMAQPELEEFFTQIQTAFNSHSLQRLILSKYQGDDAELERITVRPIKIKDELLLSFLYEYRTNHITKNLSLADAIILLENLLGTDFKNAHMLSDEWEIQLSYSKKVRFWLISIAIETILQIKLNKLM
jgi:hypothetical protein